jgi:hypothetical protein
MNVAKALAGCAQFDPVTNAYEVALLPVGKRRGFLTNHRENSGIRQVQHGIDSLTDRIDEHRAWIADPLSKLPDGKPQEDVLRYVTQK